MQIQPGVGRAIFTITWFKLVCKYREQKPKMAEAKLNNFHFQHESTAHVSNAYQSISEIDV